MRCWVDVAGLLPSRTVSRCRSVSPVGSLRLPGRAARRVSRACPGVPRACQALTTQTGASYGASASRGENAGLEAL